MGDEFKDENTDQNQTGQEAKIPKDYSRYAVIIVLVVLAALFGWAMFSDVHNDGGANDSVRSGIDGAREQQRDVETKLGTIGSGLSSGQRILGDIDKSNSAAQGTAEAIGETNNKLKAAIDDAAVANRSSEAVLKDSQRRLGICKQITKEVRKTAKDSGE